MSDEYKDRYVIIALLKTPPWSYRQCENTTMVPTATAETTINPVSQNIPVICLHLEDTTNMALDPELVAACRYKGSPG